MTRTLDARWGMIADNLRHHRGVRSWTQQDLADHSGVSRRMIAAIESAQNNVSLVTLDRLASALGISFVQLFTPPGADGRPGRRQGELIWEGKQPGSAATLLGSHPARRSVELWRWSLAAGESYQAEADPPGMHEMLYVLSGELSVELAGETHLLGAGDTLTFASDQPYRYGNPGSGTAEFVKNVLS